MITTATFFCYTNLVAIDIGGVEAMDSVNLAQWRIRQSQAELTQNNNEQNEKSRHDVTDEKRDTTH